MLAAAAMLAGPAAASALPRLSAEPDPLHGGRIVDSRGRQVILRGVNVNSLGEYWQGTNIKPTLPLERRDPARISRIGWNVVRLIVSWSRVEPKPGRYNERYLDRVAKWIRRFRAEGVYTIVDFHQDAWGATLAARPGESCPAGYEPAFGWDGAPGWATLDEGQPRCFLNSREINPAVSTAWRNFFADAAGPGGVGVQTRYTRMLAHVAERFAADRAVAGIDVMNEPNAFGPDETAQLGTFYERSLAAIRRGEHRGDGFSHLVLFEPSVLWSLIGQGPPPPSTTTATSSTRRISTAAASAARARRARRPSRLRSPRPRPSSAARPSSPANGAAIPRGRPAGPATTSTPTRSSRTNTSSARRCGPGSSPAATRTPRPTEARRRCRPGTCSRWTAPAVAMRSSE